MASEMTAALGEAAEAQAKATSLEASLEEARATSPNVAAGAAGAAAGAPDGAKVVMPAPPVVYQTRKKGNTTSCRDIGVVIELNERPQQQDSYVVIDGFNSNAGKGFFAVYDGHSGIQSASFLATSLHHRVENVSNNPAIANNHHSPDVKLGPSPALTDVRILPACATAGRAIATD